jgi:hypothetical protein
MRSTQTVYQEFQEMKKEKAVIHSIPTNSHLIFRSTALQYAAFLAIYTFINFLNQGILSLSYHYQREKNTAQAWSGV